MRTLKFRAWDTVENKWATPPYPIAAQFSETEFGFDTENGRYILVQFTGLHDKNGKEIYEGDVVQWGDSDGMKQKIDWNPHKGAWSSCEESGACSETLWLPETCEVIGNIYENPDLLSTNTKGQ